MKTWRCGLLATLVLLTCPLPGQQSRFPYHGDESYEQQVLTPEGYLGVPLGSRFTPHHDVVRYCRYLAEQSPRVQLVEYGRSAEGRALIYRPVLPKDKAGRRMLSGLLDQVFDGAVDQLVQSALSLRRPTSSELERLRALVREVEEKTGDKP